ncbi:U32 family peptidase C-terminal domain-containing protein [Candidatus Peregrinibacteria bacterium]|nr:U32 family peptidase C-terminal domain-containing protein [Candidatus Peregrinibacteria bacterium]
MSRLTNLTKFKKPELLLPAGNLSKLKIGLQYGGDAFFLGFSPFSLRCNDNGFTQDDLLEGVKLIRDTGKQFYMTMNIYPRSEKMEAIKKHLEFVRKEVKPDALLIADPGVFELVREYYPQAVIHMSVQANILNYRGVDFWRKQGASRVILPRELTLKDIKDIHEKVPGIELEFFVHGAICMAYSGRCLLSNYMTGRDSNQGACSHSCRWKYKVLDEKGVKKREEELASGERSWQTAIGEIRSKTMYLEEEKRPGKFYKVEEDDHGTYFMNSKDNCLLPYLKELAEAGICSFKVEGRNKTEYYLATVAKAYRQAVDDLMVGKKFDEKLLAEVGKTASRGFIPGYLFGYPDDNDTNHERSSSMQDWKFVGIVAGRSHDGLYEIAVRNRLDKGREIEIMTPDDQFTLRVEEMFDLDGKEVTAIHGGAGNRLLRLRKGLPVGAMLRVKCEEGEIN